MAELQKATLRAQQGVAMAAIERGPATRAKKRAKPRTGTRRSASPRVRVPTLTAVQREEVIDTFVVLLEGLYTHLPLKRAMYAVDPLQRLRLLRQRAGAIGDLELHNELATTITGLRDAHTRYIGPDSLADHVAALPFLIEAYGPAERRRYIVSKLETASGRISDRNFKAGVELQWWNAVPIDRAIEIYARQETLGRPEARRTRALESLTFRALQYGPSPDEEWVVVGYRDLKGRSREVRIEWRLLTPGRAATAGAARARRAKKLDRSKSFALDPAAETRRRAKKLLFAPKLWQADRRPEALARAARRGGALPPAGEWWDTEFQDVIGAKTVKTRHGTFGYLRLWSFDLNDHGPFIAEVMRLLDLMPERGLIIDLRANPGGLIWAAERMLQLLTPRTVVPTRFSMVATALTRAMVNADQNVDELEEWRESVHEAVATGEAYSRAAPLTPFEDANDIGQVYGGPVVAVVDANTYSAGDLFAAGFVDNEIGELVSTDDATGAGGAEVWSPKDVQTALASTTFFPRDLPAGIQYTLAVRRATRAGLQEGLPIEDIGVRGDHEYAMTKRDLTGDNAGLLTFCTDLLRAHVPTSLRATFDDDDDPLVVTAKTRGLDRLDVTIDGRPRESLDVHDRRSARVTLPDDWGELELAGYSADELKQRRRLFA